MNTVDDGSPRASAETAADPTHEEARRRVAARREFGSHLVAYLVINGFFVVIWVVTGAGYFWPAWVLGCWGAGLVLHAWDAFLRRPVTDADIDAEIDRQRRSRLLDR